MFITIKYYNFNNKLIIITIIKITFNHFNITLYNNINHKIYII